MACNACNEPMAGFTFIASAFNAVPLLLGVISLGADGSNTCNDKPVAAHVAINCLLASYNIFFA